MGKISSNELNTELGTQISKIGTDVLGTTAQDLSGAVNEHLADYAHYYKKDAGSTDAYVVALDPVITTYTEGMTLDIFCKTANTGAATLDAGGGAKDLRKYYNDALETGDIEAGAIITVKWDSANDWWQVTSGIKVTVSDASETVKGIVELATVAEVATGTDTTKVVTPAGLALVKAWEKIADITLTSGVAQVDFTDLGLENYQRLRFAVSEGQFSSAGYAYMRFNDDTSLYRVLSHFFYKLSKHCY